MNSKNTKTEKELSTQINFLKSLNKIDTIPVASVTDILLMKINAIIGRGSRKDFTEVYFILQELHLSPRQCINIFKKKYGNYNPSIICKAMTYFVDADNEPELKLIKKVTWDSIKKYFIASYINLGD